MPFFRPLSETAPRRDPRTPWPIHGLAYVIFFMGGIGGGAAVGANARGVIGLIVGLAVGLALTLGLAWLSDRYVDPIIAELGQKRMPAILANVLAFLAAVGVCAASAVATLGILLKLNSGLAVLVWSVR